MSGDAEQEYFSDGITEDLITDLSKVSALFVIARNSSFAYKGRSVKVQEIGRDLGVRFVLEGSIRKAGNRVRITAQLIDAGSGGHLWAERFDRDLTDIFATQDEVVEKIVGALAVTLTQGEQQPAPRRAPSIEAYECWLRARELLGRGTREPWCRPGRCTAARSSSIRISRRPMPAWRSRRSPITSTAGRPTRRGAGRGERWARRAIELDEHEPVGHGAGQRAALAARYDEALAELHRAVELDPNYAQGHALLGMALMYAGRRRRRWMLRDGDAARSALSQHRAAFRGAGAFQPGPLREPPPSCSSASRASPTPIRAACCWRPATAISGAPTRRARRGRGCSRSIPASRWRSATASCPTRTPRDFERIADGLAKAGSAVGSSSGPEDPRSDRTG